MEIWHYIEILRKQKQGFLFKKNNIEERLIALNKILEFGHPVTESQVQKFAKSLTANGRLKILLAPTILSSSAKRRFA
jgi:hypothetical protein